MKLESVIFKINIDTEAGNVHKIKTRIKLKFNKTRDGIISRWTLIGV
jgi:hypothetical protein